MQIVGGLTAIVCLVLGHRPTIFAGCVCFELGNYWGGISLGRFIFANKTSDDKIKKHEFGHSIQNAQWGLLFPFVIGLPSLIRSWYRNWLIKYSKRPRPFSLPPYESIWFEGQATRWGAKYWSHIWYKHLAKQKNN